ncbi:flagellar basal body M-ring protein FliF [Natronospirillum operosum]|uniref:Flagellar M-ring protein n=1 Tax=Natronospirillum operosum TaxID=2759953 RepID=A0A4Z0WBB2_9GAMM|nr:flagellar basal-body MS-ring/collar protein FliF [Natronospirillum operosum]TGG95979.1 flagellar basal body M-ring protein FliF [Natronospirillum operosum]
MENVPAAPSTGTSNAPATTSGQSQESSSRDAVANTSSVNERGGFNTEHKKPHPLIAGFQRLTMMRQLWLMVALAAAVALGFAAVLWTQGTNYRPLMSAHDSYEVRDVLDVLSEARVDFNIDPNSGLILVRDSQLHDARLAVARAGLSTDQTVGMELLDDAGGLGTSQFMETARYRRALEGELARTVMSMNQVRSARIHLAIPERSVFVRDVRQGSASVFVDLHGGTALERDQVKAIVNLVANSVPQMDSGQVSVIDQRGRLLSDLEMDASDQETDRQFQFARRVEDNLQRRIHGILERVIGNEGFQAQVSADVDFTRIEQAEELYNPDLIALRSEQLLDETTIGQADGGIPGALTNQPPGDAEAPEEVDEDGNPINPPPQTQRSESTRNYEVDRTLSYTQQQVGRLRRLTVAVAVDDMRQVNANGEVERVPWTEEELNRLRILVQDAVGFDAARGDSVNVINSAFMAPEEVIEEPPFWREPWFWEIMRYVLGGIFLLILIFGVVRPAVRNLMAQAEDEVDDDAALDALDIDEDAISDDKVTLSVSDEYLLPGPSESFDKQLEALRGLIAEDPGKVSVLMKKWIMSDD